MSATTQNKSAATGSFTQFKDQVLHDFALVLQSREASLMGRKEVLTGKAKFGIFGDGKELAQVALAKQFKPGDFRSGYYRDQTLMFALDNLNLVQYFAGLYAHTSLEHEPTSAGRQMGGHFATRSLNSDGTWKDLTQIKNSSADISPTAGQMPRLLGLAYASTFFKNNPDLAHLTQFSNNGNEVAFGTIGDASTSEGLFWETINAAGVLKVPIVMSVWDDGHGISVPKKYQTTKESISQALAGFQREGKDKPGYEILYVKAWDYPALCETYEKATHIARTEHCPVLVHVDECTQPQGHSTSGSHERYKSPERLKWEGDYDCIAKFKEWILSSAIAGEDELSKMEEDAKRFVREAKSQAWSVYLNEIKAEIVELCGILDELAGGSIYSDAIKSISQSLSSNTEPIRKDLFSAARKVLRISRSEDSNARQQLLSWYNDAAFVAHDKYSSHLYSESNQSIKHATKVEVSYSEDVKQCDGREVLRDNFDAILARYPQVMIFGEDSGKIGVVNQGLEGLQKKYGERRVFDTGIREATIMGQAIGLALRGLRPIAEIQYLDYLLYALQIMSDDLATTQYRTKGGQKAPVIVRTRGHRLEGIWHSGSPMGMIINSLRGIHVCVPRNMTKAAGFYNTLLKCDEPALVIEPLNSYRLKERAPVNFGDFCEPLGQPEVIREGTDITLVTYGPLCRMSLDAAAQLQEIGISVEVIDVQTLLPFDVNHSILHSVKKTNRLICLDEDVPGGASAYMMQQILEVQGAYQFLDSAPKTMAAKDHRPAYGTDGDYFSKPSVEDIFDACYEMMEESNPSAFNSIY